MRRRVTKWMAWTTAAIVMALTVVNLLLMIQNRSDWSSAAQWIGDALFLLWGVLLALVAALIVSHQ